MNDMNLLPEWYVRERMRNRADMFCVVLFGIVMAILMVDEYLGRRKLRDSREKYSIVKAEFETASKETEIFRADKIKRTHLLEEVKQTASGQQYFTPLLLMDLLSRCAKGSVRFDSTRMTTKWQVIGGAPKPGGTVSRGTASAAKVKPVPVRAVSVQLDGTVGKEEELSRLELQLRKTELFSDVRLEQSQVVSKTGKEDSNDPVRSKFKIRLTVKADNELIEILLQQKVIGEELEAEEERERSKPAGRSFPSSRKETSR